MISYEKARDLLDRHLSSVSKGDNFALQWLSLLRETGLDERDLPTRDDLANLAGLVDGYVQDKNLNKAFALAIPLVITIVSMGLYLSKAWCDDTDRRKKARIPDEVIFQTKPQLAVKMLNRAWEKVIEPEWVLGDSACGCSEYRSLPEKRKQKYVLSVTCGQ